MVRFLNRIKEQNDVAHPNTPYAGLTQCYEGEGCRNRCESILIVSSQWSIISLSMGTVLGATIGRSEEVNRKYLSTTVHLCTCVPVATLVYQCAPAVHLCPPVINQALDLRHLLPPAPPLYSSSGKAGPPSMQSKQAKQALADRL